MSDYELNTIERTNRVVIGAIMILFTMLTPVAPLGWFAVLPLLGTLPIFAGMYGIDPVSKLVRKEVGQLTHAVKHFHVGGHRPHHG